MTRKLEEAYIHIQGERHTHKPWPLEAPHQGPALFKQHPPAQPPAMKGIKQGVYACAYMCMYTAKKISMLMIPLM